MEDSIPKFKDPCIIPFTHQVKWTELKPTYDQSSHGMIEGSDLVTIGLVLVGLAILTVIAGVALGNAISWIIRGCP